MEAEVIRKVACAALKLEWETLSAAAAQQFVRESPVKRRRLGDLDLEAEAGFQAGPKVTTEHDRWLQLSEVAADADFDVLQWWKMHAMDFPLLAILARRYLAIPASSAPSERVFSRLKNVMTEKRGSMHPHTLCEYHIDQLI